MRYLTPDKPKSITAMRASRCYQQDGVGARRGWESMSACTMQAKADGLGGCRLRTRRAKLAGDLYVRFHNSFLALKSNSVIVS